MRLTQIKLSGFKSFVEPMTIPVPGRLVGVVGPNGCGKSNVIDAVRWVLGESRAQHLRGEKMEDVIFNGSAGRKPVSRASVELHFDNSLGRAAGQWSHYAEISVKRVLTRQGESSYFINGTHVRRRDVQDIFLGTGLGPRAYAIIEQGMISRIIEAKPEELRVFLEEAAGVSKYRERRKETESRLADTRENLARVADILSELDRQVEKLAAQAVVAEQYQALRSELALTQNLLTFSRKRDASAARERHAREIDRLTLQVEEATARLREIESGIEATRQRHYTAGDALHAAQGELYAANAEVSRLEQELDYLRSTRRRIESQLAAGAQQLTETVASRDTATADTTRWQEELVRAIAAVTARQQELTAAQAGLPEAESRVRDAQARLQEAQRAVALAEQAQGVEEASENHALRVLSQLESRRNRLQQERMSLSVPSPEEIERVRGDLADAQARLAAAEERLREIEAELPQLEARRGELIRQEQDATGRLARLEAQLAALTTQQMRLDISQKLAAWLAKHGLTDRPRLWQQLAIEPGWEDALECALGARLNALQVNDLGEVATYLGNPPPGTVALFAPSDATPAEDAPPGLTPLMARVTVRAPEIEPFVRAALAGVYALEEGADGIVAARDLPGRSMAITRQGHAFTHAGVLLYGPQSELHGVLQRSREIDALKAELPARLLERNDLRAQLAEAQAGLASRQTESRTLRSEVGAHRERAHALQLQQLRLTQNAQQASERAERIREELAAIKSDEEKENLDLQEAQSNLQQGAARIESLLEAEDAARAQVRTSEDGLATLREGIREADRALQQATFHERTCRDKIDSIGQLARTVDARIAEISAQQAALGEELARLDEAPSQVGLQQALDVRAERERLLAAAREVLESLIGELRAGEEARLAADAALGPLRDKITEVRFKEQEARLTEEQFATQLAEAGAQLEELAQLIEKRRSGALAQEIARLGEEVAALGAVNLAALEELNQARERKAFLDAQSKDLREAVDTLESAIRRIDKETRDLLQATYDSVNRNFAEMFPALFGGGTARLELTGEEILDAGLLVMAQPPGKKNSSIHLLSGGEKALTALSLVFSLFRLNPAPFCLLDEVDAPLDDPNTERFCDLVKRMSGETQFLYISHNKISMEMAEQLIGITMQEQGVSRIVAVDIEEALKLKEAAA